jgi:hypothetical protein
MSATWGSAAEEWSAGRHGFEALSRTPELLGVRLGAAEEALSEQLVAHLGVSLASARILARLRVDELVAAITAAELEAALSSSDGDAPDHPGVTALRPSWLAAWIRDAGSEKTSALPRTEALRGAFFSRAFSYA